MENETDKIEWYEIRDGHIAMKGARIIGVIHRAEGMPCVAYQISPMAGMFSSLEAAKAELEEGHARYLEGGKSQKDFYLEVLKQVVAALEAKAQKP
jgi:hypothetical protein